MMERKEEETTEIPTGRKRGLSRREFSIKAGLVALGLGIGVVSLKELLQRKPVRIVFFGNSITAFERDLDGNPETKDLKFQDWIEQNLEKKFPKIDIIQTSIGLPDGRFFHKKPNLDPRKRLAEVLTLEPEIVVIEFGNNDLKFPELWPARFEEGMREIVSKMVEKNIKIILVSPIKGYLHGNYNPDRGAEGLEILKKIAAEFNQNQVLVADVYTGMVPKEDILNKKKDCLHPNAAGHEFMGTEISKTISESGWLK